MTAIMISHELLPNPVDIAELVVMERDWAFDRLDDGELLAEVTGAWCKYRVWFNWQEESGGLTLGCVYDAKLPKSAMNRVYALLALANEKLWLGHFEIDTEDSAVAFRYTLLTQGGPGVTPEQLQTLIDTAIQECERFYPAFQSVVWGGKSAGEALEIALFDTIAEC